MGNGIMKWTPDDVVTVFRKSVFTQSFPDGAMIGSNGLTLDAQGRLIAAEHGNRRVTRTEKDGSVAVVADRYEGKRLNSPNDVAARNNGDVYFTDPTGLLRTYPAPGPPKALQRELDFNGVYRVTPAGRADLLTKALAYPNGLAFSPDGKKLYVANSRPEKYWIAFDVRADGSLGDGRRFLDVSADTSDVVPDGMKIDSAGNLYLSGPGGILVVSPAGRQLGTIQVPETVANLAWGDTDGKTLYITARTSLYRIRLKATGLRP
jgi:gluconolactonase